ncbi:hypothetical protein C1645_839397 [Glomus cerebriforme]|uniref:TLDc domain-containing protein n=1 Tax=Glomus cerebriforme TaxID=658196 RepID=A0A397S7R1_9GLOM|nr:hypothetical protein C1645_839397 [Glomus cerebriforme]
MIVKVKNSSKILGGYNPVEWKYVDGFGIYSSTKDSFIFSFNNERVENFILSRVKDENKAIYNSNFYGPSFGGGDIKIWTIFGDSYCKKASYEKLIREVKDYFTVEEYAEYQVGQQDLNTILEEASNISLALDGWSNEFKSIEVICPSKFAGVITDNVIKDILKLDWVDGLMIQFEFVFHPAMAIANLLDSNFHGESLEPDDFEIIIPYLEKVYTFEYAAHIYEVMQKYIAKADEFSQALLWASIKHSSPITAAECNWSNFGFIHSKLCAHLNNDRMKQLVALYQNL